LAGVNCGRKDGLVELMIAFEWLTIFEVELWAAMLKFELHVLFAVTKLLNRLSEI